MRSSDEGRPAVDPRGSVGISSRTCSPIHTYELSLARYWLVLCGAGGLLLFLIGARAVALALLGAVVGVFAAFLMAPDLDLFPTSLPIGASVGLVIGGVLGPASASACRLRCLGGWASSPHLRG